MKKRFRLISFFLFFLCSFSVFAAESPDIAEEGMTLWQLIENGGWVMASIGVLSVLALSLVLFFFVTVRSSALIPSVQLREIRNALEKKDFEKAKALCKDRESFLSRVVYAGVFNRTEGFSVARIKMEEEGRRVIELYWNRIGYLSDIAVISPMLGFLGTILGMIQAFNAVAFKIGEVKPIFMAYGVSQAMTTTAAGLILAIPCMMFYFFFRGRIQSLAMRAESIVDTISDYLKKS